MEILSNGFQYRNLSYLEAYPDDIPSYEGIYSWVYWPKLAPNKVDYNKLLLILDDFKNVNLCYSERTEKFKFTVEIVESGFPSNENLFGLSDKKAMTLANYLKNDLNRMLFADFFQNLCFYRPFYVGKAINLQLRLKAHFNYRTDLRFELKKQQINPNEIWVGIKKVSLSNNQQLSTIFEEILQRVLKPGLTKRPG